MEQVSQAQNVARSCFHPFPWEIKMIAIRCWMIKTSLLLTYSLREVSAVMSPLLSALTGIGQTANLSGR